jgi:hypothetical protein
MKLKREERLSVAECLISTNLRGGEEFRAFGKIESVTMPMEDGHGFEAPHRAMFTCGAKRNRSPSDLFGRPRINIRTQGTSKELRAETNSQQRARKIYSLLNDGDFVGQERIFFFLVDANRASQDDQQVAIGECGTMQVVDSDVAIADLVAVGGENGLKGAEVFEMDVPNGRCSLHGKTESIITPVLVHWAESFDGFVLRYAQRGGSS